MDKPERNYLDSSTWETLGITEDGQRAILRNPATGLPCCYDLDGMLVSPGVYERNRQERICRAAPELLAALERVAYYADLDSRTLPAEDLAIVRAAIRAARGEK